MEQIIEEYGVAMILILVGASIIGGLWMLFQQM